jgi:hypothetical protein
MKVTSLANEEKIFIDVFEISDEIGKLFNILMS